MLLWRALAWSSGEGGFGAVFARVIFGFRLDESGGVLGGKSLDNLIVSFL